jgi:lipopolysaccharide export LptBFGC system permease protein LptF
MKHRRLTRYLAANVFSRSLVACVLSVVVYAAIDLVEASSLAGASDALVIVYLFKLPSVLVHVLPLSVLVGAQLTLATMRDSGQWDAMRSCGLSPLKLIGSLLVVPCGAVVLSFFFATWIAPMGMAVWQNRLGLDSDKTKNQQVGSAKWIVRNGIFIKHGEDFDLRIARTPDGRPTNLVETRQGSVDGTDMVWKHGRGWQKEIRVKNADGGDSNALLQEAYALSATGILGNSLTAADLFTVIPLAAERGLNAAPLKAEAALRVALIAACIVLPLLCLGMSIGRETSSASRLVGLGIAAAVAYWLCLAIVWNSAVAGVLAPYWVYAVVPLLFAGVGAALSFAGSTKQV